jgi:hypothetical protein
MWEGDRNHPARNGPWRLAVDAVELPRDASASWSMMIQYGRKGYASAILASLSTMANEQASGVPNRAGFWPAFRTLDGADRTAAVPVKSFAPGMGEDDSMARRQPFKVMLARSAGR